MLNWLRRPKHGTIERRDIPDGLWAKCPKCGAVVYHKDLLRTLKVCPTCGYHHRLNASERLAVILDDGSFQETDAGMTSGDPLRFEGYPQKLAEARAKTGNADAAIIGTGHIEGLRTAVAALDFEFMGGSMGSVVGEKITRIAERALVERLPLVIFSASGGARMQEGALSLMQLAKTSAAIGRLHDARLPYISVMCDPTTGGVTASFAFQGDIVLAEPGAMIGFAGRRVIEQTIRRKLPENFQTAEFCLEHGLIDMVVPRGEMRSTLARLLRFFGAPQVETARPFAAALAPRAAGASGSGFTGPGSTDPGFTNPDVTDPDVTGPGLADAEGG
jgi:acetyl-CoA carboxylase carboxyl transferase subunit beta